MTTERTVTARYDLDGSLDELFAGTVRNLHLEAMDGNQMWLGFETEDGRVHHVWFTAKSRKSLETVWHEDV